MQVFTGIPKEINGFAVNAGCGRSRHKQRKLSIALWKNCDGSNRTQNSSIRQRARQNNKIKSLKKAIEDSAARQEKARQPEMLLSAKDLQIQEYDDALTARIIEKITVRSRNEIEIRFIGGYKKTMQLT